MHGYGPWVALIRQKPNISQGVCYIIFNFEEHKQQKQEGNEGGGCLANSYISLFPFSINEK